MPRSRLRRPDHLLAEVGRQLGRGATAWEQEAVLRPAQEWPASVQVELQQPDRRRRKLEHQGLTVLDLLAGDQDVQRVGRGAAVPQQVPVEVQACQVLDPERHHQLDLDGQRERHVEGVHPADPGQRRDPPVGGHGVMQEAAQDLGVVELPQAGRFRSVMLRRSRFGGSILRIAWASARCTSAGAST